MRERVPKYRTPCVAGDHLLTHTRRLYEVDLLQTDEKLINETVAVRCTCK